MEFSYSMDATPRVSIDANAPLFASVQGSASDLGGAECVFRTRDGQTHVMTHQVLQALDNCRSFLSMAEHVQAVRKVIPSAPAEGISRVLDSLVARRLLISEHDFIADMQAQAQALPDSPMQMLIRVGGGADSSARLLSSLSAAMDWRGHVDEVMFLSAAQSAGVRAQHRAQLEALSSATGCRTRFVETADWQAKIDRLVGGDARLKKCRDLLIASADAATPGQKFNFALSLLAGKRSIVLDEHSLWPMRRHFEFGRGLELRASTQVSARFFASQDEAMHAGAADASDALLREHVQVCGAKLGRLFDADRSSSWKSGDLRGMSLSEFLTDAGATPIVATFTGTRGAPRSLSAEDLFLLDPQSRVSLSADRERYLAQLQTAHLWSGARRAALTQSSADLPLTLDARGVLPFALPFGAAAGSGFSAMLRAICPQSVSLQLPDSIGSTAPHRRFGEIGKQAYTPDVDQFIADFLSTRASDIRAQAGPARMQTAAALLHDLAECAPATLSDFTAEYLQYLRSDLISKLQRAAEEAGANAPVHWLADLRAIITANGRALVQGGVPELHGEAAGTGPEITARLADRLRQTADAMQSWPLLWDRMREESTKAKGLLT